MNAASRRRVDRSGPLAWMTKNTVAANILMWVCLIGGVFGFMNMTKEVFPEFELDLVTITVAYPGASPEDVEQGIVLAVEEAISGIEGIVEVNSTANEGAASVVVEIDESEDAQAVYDRIKQEVDRITTFPGDAEVPNVALTARKRGVVTLVVYGDTDELSLRNLAEEVRDGLLQNPGITQVDLTETREQEIHVEVPEARLNAYGLTLQGIADSIRANVVEVSGGSISTQSGEILLRVSERRDFANQFAALPIVSPVNGTPLKLGDIAVVRDGFQDVDKYATFNGKPSIEISVSRIGEQTPIGISEATLEALEKIRPLMPQGVDIAVVSDRSDTYKQRQELLAKNAVMGLILVMVLLTIFLDWKLAFWISMGIPISFLGAMLLLPLFGVTFNMISMFAFIIALGIVVDDAIVMIENIARHIENGASAMQAALEDLATKYPSAFSGYELEVIESHQKTKADTSGTAKAVIESLKKLSDDDFDVDDDIAAIDESQVDKDLLADVCINLTKPSKPIQTLPKTSNKFGRGKRRGGDRKTTGTIDPILASQAADDEMNVSKLTNYSSKCSPLK